MSLPRRLRAASAWLRANARRESFDAGVERELAFHFEQLVAEGIENGLAPIDARRAAHRALGNVPLLAEQCRDAQRVTWLHDLRQDLAFAVRLLFRNPVFTCVVVLSLALGIGANTAILTVMNGVLRQPLLIPDADRVVIARTYPADGSRPETHASLDDYFAWTEGQRSFERVGASLGNQADFGADVNGAAAERINGAAVTAGLFQVLGVQPLLGRVFTPDDNVATEAGRVVVISHRLWQARFGGSADILQRRVLLNDASYAVVGVMPPYFHFPADIGEYWVPMRLERARAQSPERFFVVAGRLQEGVSHPQAEADLNRIAEQLGRDIPMRAGWRVRLRTVRETMYGWTLEPLLTLGAAVAMVLLVACANIAGLTLARGLTRSPEMALRSALGAGRGRLIRQLTAESVLLGVIGGFFGVGVAWAGVRLLSRVAPPPGGIGLQSLSVDGATLAIAAIVSIATGLICGVAPAIAASGGRMGDALKSGARAGAAAHPRLRETLVAAQVAVTIVLLVGAGLMLKSFDRLLSRDLHFDPERLLTFEINLPIAEYMHRRGDLGALPYFDIAPRAPETLRRVFESLGEVRGVESVAGISTPLLNALVIPSASVSAEGGGNRDVDGGSAESPPPQSTRSEGAGVTASYLLVTPGFFEAIGATLVSGRDIAPGDVSSAPWVAVVNETAARRLWPGQDPIGRRLVLDAIPEEQPREVVAVVRDMPLRLRQIDEQPVVYTSYLQQPRRYPLPGANMFGRMSFLVRGAGDPLALVPSLRRAAADAAPGRPLTNVFTIDQQILAAVPHRGGYVVALAIFATVAAILAAIGIYGVIAYSVAQRTREIGIRIALGAGAAEVVRRVGRRAAGVTGIGLASGVAASAALVPLLRTQLWGVTPFDPGTFAAATAVLVLVCALACLRPVHRAVTVDPTIALRSE